MRSHAAFVLGKFGNPIVFPCLIEELDKIGSIGAVGGLGLLGDERAIAPLQNYMKRLEAEIHHYEAIDTIEADKKIYALKEERLTVASALGRLGNELGMPYLLDFIYDKITREEVNYLPAVLDALVRLRKTSIIPRLHELINIPLPQDEDDENYEVTEKIHTASNNALNKLSTL